METDEENPEKQLLLETQKGEIESVVQLISEGVNINYQDEDRNTALHYAVRYGYLEIVKCLVRNGADLSIENSSVETPLDIADKTSRYNIEEIEMVLFKNVIDVSFNILENFMAEETSDEFSTPSEKAAKKDPKKLEKEILREIERKEEKMKTSLKSLKILNEKESTSNSMLTYEQANHVIYFLEAFAFKDFYVEESEESNQGLKLRIQDYFAPHIPDFKGGRRLVDELRTLVCSCSKTKLSVEDIRALISPDIKINNFFRALERYATYICNNIDGRPNRNIPFIDITAILHVDETIGTEFSSDGLREEWGSFIGAIHEEGQWIPEKAQEMLFNFLVNLSPAIEKEAETFGKLRNKVIEEFPYFDVKKKLREIFCLYIDSYLQYADIINKIDEQTVEIKSCLDYLKELNKDMDPICSNFTYKQANIIIFILDALIFEQDEKVQNYLKEIVLSFGIDQEKLRNTRQCLFKGSNKLISIEDIKKLVASGLDVPTFLKKLEDYITCLCNDINEPGTVGEAPDVNSILENNVDLGTSSTSVLKESLSNLLNIVDTEEEWTGERVHEILFNFRVNVPEEYDKEVRGLASLREIVVKGFHTYKDEDNILKGVFTKAVFKLRSTLFKYFYGKEVIDIFHRIKPGDDYHKIDADLRHALHKIEDEFETCFKGDSKSHISSQNEEDFEYHFFQSSLNSNQEELALQLLTKQYFKYMTIIDDEVTMRYYENPLECRQFNIRRILLNEFIRLRHLHSSSSKKYSKEKKGLRESLVTYNGVKEAYYNDLCQLYIENYPYEKENDHNQKGLDRKKEQCDHSKEQSYLVEQSVTNTLISLHRLQTYYQISNRDTISLYMRVVEGNGEFDWAKNLDLFRNWVIPEKEKPKFKKLKKHIKKWYKIKTIEVTFKDKIITIDAIKFISNILKTFYDVLSSYNIKFGNVEEAFNNPIVRTNLVIQEQMFWKSKISDNQNYGYYTFMIFKKLQKLKYTEPYIARVINEKGTGNVMNVMEKDDFIKLIEDLLDEGQYIYFLSALLDLNCEGVDLYEIVWKKICDKNLDSMRPIFEDPDHLEIIFKHLQKALTEDGNERVLNLEYNLIKYLNSIVEIKFAVGENNKALALVKVYAKHPLVERSHAKLELLKARRWELRITNWIGILSRRNINSYVTAIEKQKVVLGMCFELKNTFEEIHDNSIEFTASYLLNLSILAYTQQCLEDYLESYNSYENIYQRIRNFALHNLPVTKLESTTDESLSDFVDIVKSKKYNDLLNYSSETAEFLDILKIRVSMAWLIIWNWSKNHNSLLTNEKQIMFYTDSIECFRDIYVMKKLEQPEDRNIANIMWKIGFMNGNASTAIEKFNRDHKKAFRHLVESLQIYTSAYRLQKGYSDSSKKSLKNIFRTLHEMARDRISYIGREGTSAIQNRLDKIRETLIGTLNVTKYIQKYGYQK